MAARRDGFGAERQALVLDRLRERARVPDVVSAAAKFCRISPTTAYNALNRFRYFAAGWE
ncbi:hypothetical protein WJS89_11700 [Sphingomicrobium sp. XHP0235]|uniref:hypothetical protein n=1 Tax=Sphingomicrobium aquimarinum TaxID=3133971 RepID=UPI0031FE83CD